MPPVRAFHMDRLRPIGTDHDRIHPQLLSFVSAMGAHRSMAARLKLIQQAPLRRHAISRRQIFQCPNRLLCPFIVIPAFQTERPLPDCGIHGGRSQQVVQSFLEFQTLQPGGRQDDCIEFTLIQLPQPGIHIPANLQHFNTSILCSNLRLATQTPGPDPSSRRQSGQDRCGIFAVRRWPLRQLTPQFLMTNQHIEPVLARRHATKLQAGCRNRRQVLQAMHRQVRLTIQQIPLHFSCENTLPAHLMQRRRLILVSLSRHMHDLSDQINMLVLQLSSNEVRLPQSQSTASGGDSQYAICDGSNSANDPAVNESKTRIISNSFLATIINAHPSPAPSPRHSPPPLHNPSTRETTHARSPPLSEYRRSAVRSPHPAWGYPAP